MKTLEQCTNYVQIYNINVAWRRSGVFIINFEHISHIVLVFPLLTLKDWNPAGMILI